MAITPDTLLIFRARGDEGEDKSKKKKAAKQSAVSSPTKPMPLGKFQPPESEEPMLIPEPAKQPVQPLRPQTEASPVIKPPAQLKEEQPSKPILEAKLQIQKAQEQIKKSNLLDIDIFHRGKRQEATEEEHSIYEAQNPPYTGVRETEQSTIKVFGAGGYSTRRGATKDKALLSREAAKDQACMWHPWRAAYAICGYCHRPFCFEDTVEFNKNYYCLEDIDNVSTTFKDRTAASGNTVGIAGGAILLFSFLIFFYYSNGQVIYVLQYLNRAGLPYFLLNINYSYASALIETFLMLLGFGSALLLFLQSRKGFYLGTFTCLCSVAIFGYQYITTGTFYLGIVAIFVFVAFVALLYSSTTTVREEGPLIQPSSSVESNMIHWPNIGRF